MSDFFLCEIKRILNVVCGSNRRKKQKKEQPNENKTCENQAADSAAHAVHAAATGADVGICS